MHRHLAKASVLTEASVPVHGSVDHCALRKYERQVDGPLDKHAELGLGDELFKFFCNFGAKK